jgi:hypothetical protein
MSTTMKMSPSTHPSPSYPQELSTGTSVSRETRRRTLAHPVDRPVDGPHNIGVVSRETPAAPESTGATHRLWIVAVTHVCHLALIGVHEPELCPRGGAAGAGCSSGRPTCESVSDRSTAGVRVQWVDSRHACIDRCRVSIRCSRLGMLFVSAPCIDRRCRSSTCSRLGMLFCLGTCFRPCCGSTYGTRFISARAAAQVVLPRPSPPPRSRPWSVPCRHTIVADLVEAARWCRGDLAVSESGPRSNGTWTVAASAWSKTVRTGMAAHGLCCLGTLVNRLHGADGCGSVVGRAG